MIELKHISKVFLTKKGMIEAVKDVSLTINDGEIYGVIGYSGAGKSTLIRIINQLEKQTAGEVLIDKENLSSLSNRALRESRTKIGMIFQHFNLLWSRTILENIELPLEIISLDKKARRQRAEELIQLVGLEGRENAFPSELSGGQKQRVGIARALANHPSILLCDEATSALDPETTESILDLLVEINQKLNLTIVLITHQMEVVQKICHRIAMMSEGEVVEEGKVEELFEHPQHDVTKRFVRGLSNRVDDEKLNQELKAIYPDGMLLRLTFEEAISRQSILAEVIRKTTISISIVSANLTNTLLSSFGIMYLNIYDGNKDEYDHVITLLKEYDVLVEVI